MKRSFYVFIFNTTFVYGLIRVLENSYGHLGFFSNYFTDLLALPIILGILLWCLIRIPHSSNHKQLPFLFVLVFTLAFSIYFEWYLPGTSQQYTADAWDVVCYFIGATLFFLLQARFIRS